MTLFEALVATAILALLSAIAFPAMDRSARALAVAEARVQLVSDLRRGHGRALAEDRAVSLMPVAGGSAYRFDGATRALPDTVRLDRTSGQAITFYADGSASGATLIVRPARSGDAVIIAVDGPTGAVTLAGERRAR